MQSAQLPDAIDKSRSFQEECLTDYQEKPCIYQDDFRNLNNVCIHLTSGNGKNKHLLPEYQKAVSGIQDKFLQLPPGFHKG